VTIKAVSYRMDLPETGIYVRAQNEAGAFGSFDIAHLDRDSLHTWLRSRGGENLWAENVVMTLLGHPQIPAGSPQATSEGESK
jgi:hypothetical protein